MTTERKDRVAARPAPRLDLSGSEWKLYIAAALGVVYTAAWLAAGTAEEAGEAAEPPGEPARAVAAAAPPYVWASDRPPAGAAVPAPQGAARPAPSRDQGARPAPTSRPARKYRIRTRSS
ncbi:MAG: hypothetical protein IT372_23785 [Polyangiaceae bacterium]|nr:hypothetical protein [Polyangiaceae bacterium]